MGWVPTSIDGDHLPQGYSVLVYSMGASVDGFINDRNGDFAWTAPDAEQLSLHNELVGALGAYLCGRRLYEAMLVWETDPSMRDDARGAAFADIWTALPKVVFSRTLDTVQGTPDSPRAPWRTR